MTRIAVIGGTGYAGRHIVTAALAQGHEVTSFSRAKPADPVSGATYRAVDVTDPSIAANIATEFDGVVTTLSPRGDMVGRVRPATAALARAATAHGTRLGVIGGAG